MFVPRNLTNAFNNDVYNGQHVDAAGVLRDLGTLSVSVEGDE